MARNVLLAWDNPTSYTNGTALEPAAIEGHRIEARLSPSLPWVTVAETEGPAEGIRIADVPNGTWFYRVFLLTEQEESDPAEITVVVVDAGPGEPEPEPEPLKPNAVGNLRYTLE